MIFMALVAKSYKGLKQIGEEYIVNGKMYIKVELANGNTKQVRAYSAKEYAKYYPNEEVPVDPYKKSQKEVLGFKEGYITIFKGNTYPCKEWFKENGATYRKWWGWSFPSGAEIPTPIPEGVEPVTLKWDLVGDGDSLKPEDAVKTVIETLVYEPDVSEYIGSVGERLELTLVVEKVIHLNGYYGASNMHIMRDEDENIFVWTTASKFWEEGTERHIRGTVKDHKTYKGAKQTILTRCAEVKKC